MDPLADMLVRLKNAQVVKKQTAAFSYSRLKMDILKLLQREGFVEHVARKGRKVRKTIEVRLGYDADGSARIQGARRISKPSRRVYCGVETASSRTGHGGLRVLTTPKGVLSAREAKREHVGGEVICEVW